MTPTPDQNGAEGDQYRQMASTPDQDGPETGDQHQRWVLATKVLRRMLDENRGTVSSILLCRELENQKIGNAREMNTKLRFFNFDDPPPDLPRPTFRYYHRGRSFYSEEAYRKAEKETEDAARAAEQGVQAEQEREEEEEEIPAVRRRNRQDEARMGKYIQRALEGIYDSDSAPDAPIAFDIHNERPGTEFENVDAIAVH